MDKDVLEFEGIVESVSNGKFVVRVNENYTVLCTLAGKIRQAAIRVIVNDRVSIEVSPYDTTLGRIVFRHKS
jgi:translation initiation factor IF-1